MLIAAINEEKWFRGSEQAVLSGILILLELISRDARARDIIGDIAARIPEVHIRTAPWCLCVSGPSSVPSVCLFSLTFITPSIFSSPSPLFRFSPHSSAHYLLFH